MATNVTVTGGANITIVISESPFAVGTVGQWTGLQDAGAGVRGDKVSQVPIQIVAQHSSNLRLSQAPVQVVATAKPNLRLSQLVIQIIQGRQVNQPRITIMT